LKKKYLIIFKIPAFDLLVLTHREEVRLPWADFYSTNSAHMTSERELQSSTGEIPNLDNTISSSSHKPLIARLNIYTPYPPMMTADNLIKTKKIAVLLLIFYGMQNTNPEQFPRGMPHRFGHCGSFFRN
jgi:hypothetical protein